jgi:hypothetical protein
MNLKYFYVNEDYWGSNRKIKLYNIFNLLFLIYSCDENVLIVVWYKMGYTLLMIFISWYIKCNIA